MRLKLTTKDKLFLIGTCLVCVLLSLLGWLLWGNVVLIAALPIGLGIAAIAIQLELFRRLQGQLQKMANKQYIDYRQIEALFSVFSLIDVNEPFPLMRDSAIAPDFARVLIGLIRERKPRLIVEAGSGVSTLVAAYCLRQIGAGRIIAFEHLEKYAAISMNNLLRHGMQDIATVVYAPLTEIPLRGEPLLWYDTAEIEKIDSVDMVIVDGPPGIQKLSRYPALPILFELLSEDAVIILDDARREKRIVDLWLDEFDGFEPETIDSEKGIVILRRAKSQKAHP